MAQKHVFKKVEFQIDCNNQENAMELSDTITNRFLNQTLAQMENDLDNLISKDTYLEIESIDININDISIQNLAVDLDQQFKTVLTQKIRGFLEQSEQGISNPNAVYKNDKGKVIKPPKKTSEKQKKETAILQFLKTGTLPFWASSNLKKELENECINYINTHLSSIQRELQINSNSQIVLRLLNLIKKINYSEKLKSVFKTIKINSSLVKLINDIENIKADYNIKDDIINSNSLRQIIENLVKKILLGITQGINAERQLAFQQITAELIESFSQNHATNNQLVLVEQSYISIVEQIGERFKIKQSTVAKRVKDIQETREINSEEKKIEKPKVDVPEELQELFIGNAGLSIIYPYLSAFLKNVELVKNKELIDPVRACLLLQYLCTGDTEFHEHELVLNKLICGINIEESIPLSINLNQNEIDQTEDLLKAVIANWKSMSGSSIEGLRETFIRREGVLIYHEPNWLLRVERTGVDILIDGLEWGFSMLKFPWNEHFINVEW